MDSLAISPSKNIYFIRSSKNKKLGGLYEITFLDLSNFLLNKVVPQHLEFLEFSICGTTLLSKKLLKLNQVTLYNPSKIKI